MNAAIKKLRMIWSEWPLIIFRGLFILNKTYKVIVEAELTRYHLEQNSRFNDKNIHQSVHIRKLKVYFFPILGSVHLRI